jgi:hypothetical protein
VLKRLLVILALLAPGITWAQTSGGPTGGPVPYAPSGTLTNGQCLVYSSAPQAFQNQACGSGSGITALTGDVTASGPGSATSTIAAGAVTLAKQANLAANSVEGNNTGSPATPLSLTAAQTKTLLAIANTDVSGLGTASTAATGTSGATIPLLNGTNTWAGTQTFGSGVLVATAPSLGTPSALVLRNATGLWAVGTGASATGCSATSINIGANANTGLGGGSFLAGVSGTCAVVFTLPAVAHYWDCIAHDVTLQVNFVMTAASTTGCTISYPTQSGDLVTLTLQGS